MSGTQITVTGGSGGVTAAYDDIVTEGQQLASLSGTLLELAGTLERMLVDGDVVASAALDPAGAAAFEGDLLAALDGPVGLVAVAAGIGTQGLTVQAAVATYRAADSALTEVGKALDYGATYAAGKLAPIWAPAAVLGLAVAGGGRYAWDTLVDGMTSKEAVADLGGIADRWVAEHSWIASAAVNDLPGIVNGAASDFGLPPILPASVPGSAALVGLLYPDGSPVVSQVPVTSDLTANPAGVGDLLQDVQSDEGVNKVVIREVTQADGSHAWIVEVPGTKTWEPPTIGGPVQPDTMDAGTNVRSMANEQTTYEQGVKAAMAQAGIPPTEPVMIVGHSQGGMIATQTANDLSGTYNVTHVVTAASPVANMQVPSSVQELSLQNDVDVVPQLAGTANPDTPNHTTVTFDAQNDDVVANHTISTGYAAGAAAVDASDDPSIARWRQGTDVFFNGTSVSSTQWSVSRGPGH